MYFRLRLCIIEVYIVVSIYIFFKTTIFFSSFTVIGTEPRFRPVPFGLIFL
jgi:hypothetical protein